MVSRTPVRGECHYCGDNEIFHLATMCNACWELDTRIRNANPELFRRIAEENGWIVRERTSVVYKRIVSINRGRRKKVNNAERRNILRTIGARTLMGINWLLVKTAAGLLWVAKNCRYAAENLMAGSEEE